MTAENWFDAQARSYTAGDLEEYKALRLSLSKIGCRCGSCGPHSYPAMRRFLADARPATMLEIGFNQGLSSMFWVSQFHGPQNLVSVDISPNEEAEADVSKIAYLSGRRFRCLWKDSGELQESDFLEQEWPVAAFVDGDHGLTGVVRDIESCRRLQIRHLLFDDWLPKYGDVQEAVRNSGLRLRWVMGNMAYCTDDMDQFRQFEE